MQKMRDFQKDDLNRFRKYAEERLDRLSRDPKRPSMQFQPLDKVYRSVVFVVQCVILMEIRKYTTIIPLHRHEIAEIAGLMAISYGQEGIDRYIVVYKRECPPSEDEMAARRDGSDWNEAIAKEYRANVGKTARACGAIVCV